MKTKSIRCSLLVSAVLAPLPLAAAIWDGGLSHSNFTLNDFWSTGNNWQDAVPVSGATTDVVFVLSGLRTTATQNLAVPFTLRSLTFSSGSNVVAVTGSQLNVASGGNIAQNSSVSAVVGSPINWNSIGTVTGSGTAPLTLNSTLSGNAALRFVGAPGGTVLSVTVNGSNTHIGGTFIGQSAAGFTPVDLTLGSNTAAGTATIQFFNGNTIRAGSGARSLANPIVFSTSPNGLSNTFVFGGGDELTLKGAIDAGNPAKTLQVDNAVTRFDGDLTGAAALLKTGSGTLELNGNNSGFSGSWTVDGGMLKLGGTTAIATTAVTVNGPGAADGFDTSGQTNVTLTSLNGTGGVRIGNSSLTLGSGNAGGVHSGRITANSLQAGTLKKVGTGSVSLSGAGSTLKSIAVENGTFNLNGGSMQLGAGFTVGATLSASPLANLSSGTLLTCDANSGSIVSGPAGTSMVMDGIGTGWNSGFQVVIGAGFGPGASTGLLTVKNGATLNGTFHLVGAGNSNEVGTLKVESAANVTSGAGVVGFITGSIGAATVTGQGSQWTNTASFGVGGFSQAQKGGTGTVVLADHGVLSVNGPSTFWTAGNRIDVKGGQFVTDTLVTNNLTDATVALSDPDESTSAMTIGTLGGSTTFPGILTNSTEGPGGITKTGSGTVTLNGTVGYTGATRVNAGKLVFPQSFPFATLTEVKGGAILEFTGTWGTNTFSQTTIAAGGRINANGVLKGTVTNSGLIEVAGSKSLVMTGTVVNNGVLRISKGATFSASGSFVNNGVIDIISAGSFTFPPGFVNNGRVVDAGSIVTTITKVDTLVTISTPRFYGGHIYQLQASDSPAAPFVGIGIPFVVNSDQPFSTDLGEIDPRRFYRFKVD